MAQQPSARKPTAPDPAASRTPDRLELRPVVHVHDMAASVAFYQRLGGEIIHGRPDDEWVLMQLGTAQIDLVTGPPETAGSNGAVELTFAAGAPVEQLQQVLPGARLTTHRTFGRQLLVRSPDGLLIRIAPREADAA
jgi:catechol 2,3-dioxygenase-like lactoylglutathione lyase family enzyme